MTQFCVATFERESLAASVVHDSLPVNTAAGFRYLFAPYLLSCYDGFVKSSL